MKPISTYPRCSSKSTSALPRTMLARFVHRWSLVEGGSLPGSMKAPITPPSNKIVSPGQRRRCASVAARSGMPTPANTTCPSLSWRALNTASSSAAVWPCALVIIDAHSGARGLQQLIHADQGEELVPRFWSVDELVQILPHPADRLFVDQADIALQMAEHRFIDAVAFMRRTSEWQLDDRIDRKEWHLGLIGGAPDLIVGNDAFRRQDHLVGGHRQID